jgi:hypothetical protein
MLSCDMSYPTMGDQVKNTTTQRGITSGQQVEKKTQIPHVILNGLQYCFNVFQSWLGTSTINDYAAKCNTAENFILGY